MHPPKRIRRVLDVLVRVRRRERQREHLLPGPLGRRQPRLVGEALAVEREPVEREEVDARRDVLGGERLSVRVPVRARELRVDAEDVDVVRVDVARVASERVMPGSSATAASYASTWRRRMAACRSTFSSWTSASAAIRSGRFALKPATRMS